ncbi:hypothetical protein [Virgibacillus oceani]|nr:hypothetical protein [Virgibacillus oceani]
MKQCKSAEKKIRWNLNTKQQLLLVPVQEIGKITERCTKVIAAIFTADGG